MKVALLNTVDTGGGAARAAYRLHQTLLSDAIESKYLVKHKKSKDNNTFVVNSTSKEDERINRLIRNQYINTNRTDTTNTFFSETYGTVLLNSQHLFNADIINLHWVEEFVTLKVLEQIVKLNKPIVWTLHDERPFTGGCHYTAGCTQYTENCSDCKQLASDPFHLPMKVLQQKMNILKDADLTIVTPSRWLAEVAKKSTLFKDKRVEVIPNSVETDIFLPYPKIDAKKEFGIGEDVVTLMFGAQTNKEQRKGFNELLAALKICLNDNRFYKASQEGKILILLFGSGDDSLQNLPIKILSFGTIEDDHKLAKIYSATDLFILPSLEDNLPNTMLESMSCGTLVVGFETGGIPDVVKDHKNGIVVKQGDSGALAEEILELVFDPELRKKFSTKSRKTIEKKFSFSNQSKTYRKLFKELLSEKKQSQPSEASLYDEEIFSEVIDFSRNKAQSIEKEKKLKIQIAVEKEAARERQQDIDLFRKTFLDLCQVQFIKNPRTKISHYKTLIAMLKEFQPKKIYQIPGSEEFMEAYKDFCDIRFRKEPVKKLKNYKKLLAVWHKYKGEIK